MDQDELLAKMNIKLPISSEKLMEKLDEELAPRENESNGDLTLRRFETMRTLYPDHEVYGDDAQYAMTKSLASLEWNRGERPEEYAQRLISAMDLRQLFTWFHVGASLYAMRENPTYAKGIKVSADGGTEWIR